MTNAVPPVAETMSVMHADQASPTGRPARRVVIAATFTAEPLKESMDFWMQELEMPAAVEFAPYDQVFQQLLDPASLLAQNRCGVNVVLLPLMTGRARARSPKASEVLTSRSSATRTT